MIVIGYLNQIHQQTHDPSVTVYKRMDKDELLMRQCCQFERMQFGFVPLIPARYLSINAGIRSGGGCG